MKIKQLNYGALLFFIVIILALSFHWITAKNYDASKTEVLEVIANNPGLFPYAEFNEYIKTDNSDEVIFVDIRDEESFENEHMEGSINLPFNQITSRSAKKIFKKDKKKIIIANNEADAQIARITLLGIGFENIFVMPGNFKLLKEHVLREFHPEYGYYSDDKAKFDYSKYMNVNKGVEQESENKSFIPEVKEEKVSVQGGC